MLLLRYFVLYSVARFSKKSILKGKIVTTTPYIFGLCLLWPSLLLSHLLLFSHLSFPFREQSGHGSGGATHPIASAERGHLASFPPHTRSSYSVDWVGRVCSHDPGHTGPVMAPSVHAGLRRRWPRSPWAGQGSRPHGTGCEGRVSSHPHSQNLPESYKLPRKRSSVFSGMRGRSFMQDSSIKQFNIFFSSDLNPTPGLSEILLESLSLQASDICSRSHANPNH